MKCGYKYANLAYKFHTNFSKTAKNVAQFYLKIAVSVTCWVVCLFIMDIIIYRGVIAPCWVGCLTIKVYTFLTKEKTFLPSKSHVLLLSHLPVYFQGGT